MEFLHLSLQLLCLLSITGFIITCELELSGVCCNKCEPGFYAEKLCSNKQQTICKPCPHGLFSDNHHFFKSCEECRTCEQDYSQKCTPTTDAECSCRHGFLCSNNICSKCEKFRCGRGERLKTTAVLINNLINLTKYTHECEPLCQNHEYYNEKEKVCMPRTLCSAPGLVELFAGNKTHNAICQSLEMQTVYMVVIAGFVLLMVTIAVVLSYHSVKKIKKIKASQAIKVTTVESCPLSTEETIGPVEVEHKEYSFG